MERYFHLFANGDDAKDFITTKEDFKSAFNRIAICSHISGATVLSASVEDTHPHALLRGSQEQCFSFKDSYQDISMRHIARTRGSTEGVQLKCELYEITDNQYLRNVAAYTIVQATKDGKAIMPYDYYYGTGALYFRKPWSILPWVVDEDGNLMKPSKIEELTYREKRQYYQHNLELPGDWLVCNGFILPTNYVDIEGYEKIFVTPNCFRAYLSSGKTKDEPIMNQMARVRGIIIEDLEARQLCADTCLELFRKRSTRHLKPEERIVLAQTLRKNHHLSIRQISMLTKIPENELRKYVR